MAWSEQLQRGVRRRIDGLMWRQEPFLGNTNSKLRLEALMRDIGRANKTLDVVCQANSLVNVWSRRETLDILDKRLKDARKPLRIRIVALLSKDEGFNNPQNVGLFQFIERLHKSGIGISGGSLELITLQENNHFLNYHIIDRGVGLWIEQIDLHGQTCSIIETTDKGDALTVNYPDQFDSNWLTLINAIASNENLKGLFYRGTYPTHEQIARTA